MKLLILSTLLFHTIYSNAQLSEAERLNRCKNNKDAIAQLEKDIKSVNTNLGQAWPMNTIERARDIMSQFTKALMKVREYKPLNPDQRGSDKDILKKTVEHLFMEDVLYTNHQYTLQYFFNRDFKEDGRLKGNYALNTQARLKIVRDTIAKKIDRANALRDSRKSLEAKLTDLTRKLTDYQKRLIDLKCDEISTAKTETKTTTVTKSPEKFPKPSTIDLSETTAKYGTFTISMKNTKDLIYEGTYNNGQKAVFILSATYVDGVFSLQRTVRTTAFYSGRIEGSSVTGTVTGLANGTFTATLK